MTIDPSPSASSPFIQIAARTRRQAMDWSLVLASQGIEHSIEHTEESGWLLILATPDHEKALAAIRQFRLENRPWRRPIFKSELLFDWGSTAWVSLTIVFFWLEGTRASFRDVGMMDGAAVAHGEWWRLFTATLLHANIAHWAMNAAFGFVLIGLAMGRCGTGLGLLAAYLSGAAGNMAGWLVYGEAHRSLGASGVVMGALGLLAAQSVSLLRRNPHALKLTVGGVAGGLMLFVLLGLSSNPTTDVVAHGGGFVAGLLLGAGLAVSPKLTRSSLANLTAGFLFAALVILTWALALSHGG
jgi:membrane associated rhomboid family serine protease